MGPQPREILKGVLCRHRHQRQRGCLSVGEPTRSLRDTAYVGEHVACEGTGNGRHHRISNREASDVISNRGYDAGAFSAERLGIFPHRERVQHIPKIQPTCSNAYLDLSRSWLPALQRNKA